MFVAYYVTTVIQKFISIILNSACQQSQVLYYMGVNFQTKTFKQKDIEKNEMEVSPLKLRREKMIICAGKMQIQAQGIFF